MALPPLADVSDLAAWVGREISADDPRAGAVLSHASTKVRAFTGQTWPLGLNDPDLPDIASQVVVRVAARVFRNPDEADSVTLDDGTLRGLRGLVLTDEDRADLAGLRSSTAPAGLGVVSTFRGDAGYQDTFYVPTAPAPSGQWFPWLSTDEV